MTRILWDKVGERRYETGVDRGVLYILSGGGLYDTGFGWNGLTKVTESPGGASSNKQYADNGIYLNLISAETFDGTIEAFTYPDAFGQCDGTAEPQPGVALSQQRRKTFGLCYRTLLGNDVSAADYGYKLHLAYGLTAAPSEKAHETVNDSPAALNFSWGFSSIPVDVGTIGGTTYKPTSLLTIDSTKVNATALQTLEDTLYGTAALDPSLPLPADVIAMFSGTITSATPAVPTYTPATHTIAIPTTTGVTYRRTDTGAVVTGNVVLTTGQQVIVKAYPNAGYNFPANTDTDWQFNY